MPTTTSALASASTRTEAARPVGLSRLLISASVSSIALATFAASPASAQVVINSNASVQNPGGQTVTLPAGTTQTVEDDGEGNKSNARGGNSNVNLEDDTNDDTTIIVAGTMINNDTSDEEVAIFVDNSEDRVVINVESSGIIQGVNGVIFYEGDGAIITNAGRIEGTGEATEAVLYFDRDSDGSVNSVTNSGIITSVGGATIGVDTLLGTDSSSSTVGGEEGIARFTLVNTGTISNTGEDSDADAINFNGDPGNTGGTDRGCLEGAQVNCRVEVDITNSGTISAVRDNSSNAAIRVEEDVAISGTIANLTGGTITSASNAITINGAHADHNLTITNAGTIAGTSSSGIFITGAGVTVENQMGGTITGGDEGILIQGTVIDIDTGESGPDLVDVEVAATGNTVSNAGTISGGDYGVRIGANAAGSTVINDGTFTGGRGFQSDSGGALVNNGTITATANQAIRFTTDADATATLGAASVTETQGDGDAILFEGAGTNTLNIAAGASVTGDIQGSDGTGDALALSGMGDGGTLQVQGFETLTANGGDFTLGADTTGFANGLTVNSGSLTVNGATDGNATVGDAATLGGTGTIGGTVTVADDGTIAAGDNAVGTLTTGGLALSAGSVLNFELGAPDTAEASDRIQVNGDLTLDGTLNTTDVGGFGEGVYRLIDFTGALVDNGLEVGELPMGTEADQAEVQSSVANQINLVISAAVGGTPNVQFWDGTNTMANGMVDGGDGSWDLTTTNWTNAAGDANAIWNSNFAVFQGTAGTVTVDSEIAFTGLQFVTDGYTLAQGTGTLTIAEASTNVRTDPGATATIAAAIGGAGGINKLDTGTLVLSGANTYTGNTTVAGGTLVLDGSIAGGATVSDGATLSGNGTAAGAVTVAAATVTPGGTGTVGTLTTGGLALTADSVLNYDFGAPDTAGSSDRIQVDGDLTLDGTLNANDVGGFGEGVYRLIDFTGALVDNGLEVGALPMGFADEQAEVQSSVANQINLVISAVGVNAPDVQFWDGTNTMANGMIDGGDGSWDLTTTNWTNAPGTANLPWNSNFAVFQGEAGTVTVDGAIAFTGLQFVTDGYTLAQGTGSLTINDASTNVRTDPDATATIAAAIGGTGGINKLDTGTLILSGANTYTGNTTVAGGTLVLDGSIAGGATISDGATLSGSGTAAGAVTVAAATVTPGGAGTVGTLTTGNLVLSENTVLNYDFGAPDTADSSDLIQVNGDLTLDGTLNANDVGQFGVGVYRLINYTGGLTDNGLMIGTLPMDFDAEQAEVQTSMMNQINLVISAPPAPIPDIQFWDGSDEMADGVIDGGDGSWNLTDTNWTNAAGDANAAWNSNFAVFAGAAGTVTVDGEINFNGLQFMTDGYTLTAADGSLNIADAATAVRVDPGVTATISAPIGGAGGINKLDTGTLVLNGDHSFTGDSIVAGGMLVVNGSLAAAVSVDADAMLGGSGEVGGLTVTGTVAPGNSIGTLNVAGDVIFAAGSQYDAEISADGTSDLIAATGTADLVGGTVNVLADGTQFAISTDYTILTADDGVNGTFAGVNSNLAFLTPTLSYTDETVLLNVTRNDVAFASIGATPNQVAAATAVQSQGNSVLANRILTLDADAARDAFGQLAGELQPTVRTVMAEDNRLVRNVVLDHLASTEGRSLWGEAWGVRGESDGDRNAAELERDSYGLLIGVDQVIGDTASIGLALSYSDTDIDLEERAGSAGTDLGSGNIQAVNALAYVGLDFSGFNLRAGAGYGWHDIETNRSVNFTGFTDALSAGYSGNTLFGFAEAGYRVDMGGAFVEPYAGVTFIKAETEAFSETGAQSALRGGDESDNSTISVAGIRVGTSEESSFMLRGKAGWQHGFGDLASTSTLRFGDGNAFTVAGAPQSRNAGFVQAEAGFQFSETGSIGVAYDGLYGDNSQDHAVVGRITIGF